MLTLPSTGDWGPAVERVTQDTGDEGRESGYRGREIERIDKVHEAEGIENRDGK